MNQPDISFRKHGNNERANEAWARASVRAGSDKEAILSMLSKANLTSKEIARKLQKSLNSISGRFSQLRQDGLIRITDEEPREGCNVYELIMDEQEIPAAVRREQLAKTILDLNQKCGYSDESLHVRLNSRFLIEDGLDGLSFVEFEQIRQELSWLLVVLDLNAQCGYTRSKLNEMVNTRFRQFKSIAHCDLPTLEKIRAGLQKKADAITANKEDW